MALGLADRPATRLSRREAPARRVAEPQAKRRRAAPRQGLRWWPTVHWDRVAGVLAAVGTVALVVMSVLPSNPALANVTTAEDAPPASILGPVGGTGSSASEAGRQP